jgi:glycosyltransferase involved in cell wall biosynthesis
MRIAYVANYQGPTLIARRPVVRNLSMSNRVKMELLSTLLRRQSHEVVLISPGEPGEYRFRLYSSFRDSNHFDPQIPVEYASALPVKRVAAAWSSLSTLRLLRKWHTEKPFDLLVIFNMNWPQLTAAAYAIRTLRVPVVLEYEDDAFTSVHDVRLGPFSGAHRAACERIMKKVSGCVAVSPYLASQLPANIPKLLLRGVVGPDIIQAEQTSRGKKQNWVVFAGTHIESNGVAPLIEAWKQMNIPGWELHITGHGHLTPTLQASAAEVPTIVFHGLVDRTELVRILSSAKVCINPHTVSETPGLVFAFKIIEYLAAGAHVVTTPMGEMDAALESSVTYLVDNTPKSIVATLTRTIREKAYRRTAASAAQASYDVPAVAEALERLLAASVSRLKSSRGPRVDVSLI